MAPKEFGSMRTGSVRCRMVDDVGVSAPVNSVRSSPDLSAADASRTDYVEALDSALHAHDRSGRRQRAALRRSETPRLLGCNASFAEDSSLCPCAVPDATAAARPFLLNRRSPTVPAVAMSLQKIELQVSSLSHLCHSRAQRASNRLSRPASDGLRDNLIAGTSPLDQIVTPPYLDDPASAMNNSATGQR